MVIFFVIWFICFRWNLSILQPEHLANIFNLRDNNYFLWSLFFGWENLKNRQNQNGDLLPNCLYSKWYFNWGNDLLPKKDGTPYNTEKGAFRGHPCTIWAAQNIYNTAWLIQHGFGLLEEYTHRYGKVHASQALIEWCADNMPDIPDEPMTKMPQCMPDEFKEECSVSAYRHFYNVDKRRSFKCVWTDREEPQWWKEHTCLEVSL